MVLLKISTESEFIDQLVLIHKNLIGKIRHPVKKKLFMNQSKLENNIKKVTLLKKYFLLFPKII
tara:strand:+ start:1677 stop:1868 length:192 start_codon:yes stop_codon:yes gene_type:complete